MHHPSRSQTGQEKSDASLAATRSGGRDVWCIMDQEHVIHHGYAVKGSVMHYGGEERGRLMHHWGHRSQASVFDAPKPNAHHR